jgi:anti-sigma regulatory factor (Ser/Thr protein kinase)
VVGCLHKLGLDAIVFAVETSVDEACTNVIKYAYDGVGGTVNITCELFEGVFTITIRDSGKPFDPATVRPPDLDASLYDRRIGGLGIYLMHKLMDEVNFSRTPQGENLLQMKKRVGPGAS